MRLHDIPTKTNLLIMQLRLAERMGIACTPDTWVLTVDVPRQMGVCLVCEDYDIQNVLSLTVNKVQKPLAFRYPLSTVTRFQFMHSSNFVRV